VFENEGGRRKKEKKLVKEGLRTWNGRANLLEMEGLAWHSQARPCHFRHEPCQGSGHPGQLPTKQLKTTKSKQNKKQLNVWVASHEALVWSHWFDD